MDHLPLPHNPTIPEIKIPYLCTKPYDGGSFQDYPARIGWELANDNNRNGPFNYSFKRNQQPATAEDTAELLQTWFYFGLLSRALGSYWKPDMQQQFLITDAEGKKWLTTRSLESIIVDWASHMVENATGVSMAAGSSVNGHKEEIRRQHERFDESARFIQYFIQRIEHFEIQPFSVEQMLALMALGSYLNSAWHRILVRLNGNNPVKRSIGTEAGRIVALPFLTSHMRKMNWCLSDISRIEGDSGYQFATHWYFANMHPPRSHMDHSECSKDYCSGGQLSSSKASGLTCECPKIEAKLDDIVKNLDGFEIPVLHWQMDSGENDSLIVGKASENQFVAISHVWSEGLGDPDHNALPFCEVARLFHLIKQLPLEPQSLPALWIDTVCVPLKKYRSEAHGLAMQKMRITYEKASAVLVLDAYVQSFRLNGATEAEAFARVVNSTWIQRLWTLQEGRLAQRLFFQFADGPRELREIFNAVQPKPFPTRAAYETFDSIIMSYNASKLHNSDEQETLFKPLYEGIFAVRRAVVNRGLTIDDDEGICLSVLLNVDMEAIAASSGERRMAEVWRLLPKIPLSLIFSKKTRKLSIPGYRWAPASFRGKIPNELSDSWAGPDVFWGREAKRTNLGLLVQLPGVFLLPINTRDGWCPLIGTDYYIFRLPTGCWLVLRLQGPWNQTRADKKPEKSKERLVLIMDDHIEAKMQFAEYPSIATTREISLSKFFANGLVGSISQEDGESFHVSGWRHGQVMKLPLPSSTLYNVALSGADKLRESMAQATIEIKPVEATGTINPEVAKRCTLFAKEALLDPTLLETCRKEVIHGGQDGSDEECMNTLAGFTNLIYEEGYNIAELAPIDCTWCID